MGRSAGEPVRIGVYGGSFDPIHRGHLAVASHAADELGLDKVVFIPSPQNPLKKGDRVLPPALRARLVRTAIRQDRRFVFSDIELRRKGPSYTSVTLRELKQKYGRAQLYFLAGADQVRGFSRWKAADEVLKLSRFTVLTRPGHRLNTRDRRFLWLPMPPMDVSSSQVRRRLERGQDIAPFVPPGTAGPLERYWKQERKSSKPRTRKS